MNGTVILKFFSLPQAIENSRIFLLLRTLHRKQSLCAPGIPGLTAVLKRPLNTWSDSATTYLLLDHRI